MSDYGLTVKNILESLPCVLAEDENIVALAEGIAKILVRQIEEIEYISVYPHLDTASEEMCDILARDFDVGWYSYDYLPEIKRGQIRSTFRVHKKLGTVAAVKELVRTVFGQGEVTEWFDYGGEPYHFRIQTDTALNADTYNYIYNMIRLVKSVRSRLDSVQILRNTEAAIYAGTAQCMVYHPPAVTDGFCINRDLGTSVPAGASAAMVYRPAAIIDGGRINRTTVHNIFVGIPGGSVFRPAAIFEIEGGKDYASANE